MSLAWNAPVLLIKKPKGMRKLAVEIRIEQYKQWILASAHGGAGVLSLPPVGKRNSTAARRARQQSEMVSAAASLLSDSPEALTLHSPQGVSTADVVKVDTQIEAILQRQLQAQLEKMKQVEQPGKEAVTTPMPSPPQSPSHSPEFSSPPSPPTRSASPPTCVPSSIDARASDVMALKAFQQQMELQLTQLQHQQLLIERQIQERQHQIQVEASPQGQRSEDSLIQLVQNKFSLPVQPPIDMLLPMQQQASH